MEPVDRQQQKTERLPPVIPAADMRLLVGDYIRQSAAVHGIRKIDFWLDDPQYERRAGIFALIDIIPQNHGFADSAAQTPIAYGGIKEKRGGSGAGVNIQPVAFLVIKDGCVRTIQLTDGSNSVDRALAMLPELVEKVSALVSKKGEKPADEAPKAE